MAHDPTRLLRRLNSYCTQALTAAASLCQARGHSHITVEHWLLKLFEQGEGDLVVIARRYEWDMDAIWEGLLDHFNTLPRSVLSKPQLSGEVQQLITNAWLLASLNRDCTQLRSVHLLEALFETPTLLKCSTAWPLSSIATVQSKQMEALLEFNSEEGQPEQASLFGSEVSDESKAVVASRGDASVQQAIDAARGPH